VRKNSRLPNFRNIGTLLRILLIVNILAMLDALLLSTSIPQFLSTFTELSAAVEPLLILSLVTLFILNPILSKLKYWQGILTIMLIESTLCIAGFTIFNQYFSLVAPYSELRACLLATIVASITLFYFNLQQRAYSPAIAEARLQALQARIRPHFLFNSINAVLSLIRSQPKRAETALEDMADLFRVLMADNRDLVPLAQEIALCRQYLSIEKLRLEERLSVNWQIAQMPPDALIPPLILQPLIENAVYHGIEPLAEGGEINIQIFVKNHELTIIISNPYLTDKQHHQGNKMALRNIKERLLLHFDLEASLSTKVTGHTYEVEIHIPS
jgi:two-component system, LytTR family, sensor histidine kinase AlgZ